MEKARIKEQIENEGLFQATINDLQIGLALHNPDTSMLFCNPEAARMLGVPMEEAVGKLNTDPVWQFIREDGSKMPVDEFPVNQSLAAGKTVSDMIFGITGAGREEPIWCKGIAVPVFSETDEIIRVIVNFVDITDIKKADNEIRNSEELLQSTLNGLTDHIALLDKNGTILLVNNAWTRFAEENGLEGPFPGAGTSYLNACDTTDPDVEKTHQDLRDLLDGRRESFSMEYPCNTKSKTYWFRAQFSPLPNDNFNRIVVTHTDITEQKLAKDRVRKLFVAIEQIPENVIITSSDGIIEYVNPSFKTTTGYSLEEVLNQTPRILKSGIHSDSFYREMWETLAAGGSWKGRIVNKHKNNSLYTEEVTISPVKNEHGVITHYVAVKRDITNELIHEQETQHAQKMEAVGVLAGGIAHDFNNILQSIQGYSELLLSSLEKESTEYATAMEMKTCTRTASNLTRELLLFSRKLPANPQSIDLNTVVRDSESIICMLINKVYKLEFFLHEPLPEIMADHGKLVQVLINLMLNARDAMPDGGSITVSTSTAVYRPEDAARIAQARPGRHVCLSVTDTGIGMHANTLEKIFDPFFTSKEVGKGTGLGLSVVFGVVKQYNGWTQVESELGKGSCFRIFFPVADSQNHATEETSRPGDE